MKKQLITLVITTLIVGSCGQSSTKKQAVTTENIGIEVQQEPESPFETNEVGVRRTIKYFFQANGGAVLFFDDETAFTCPHCELVYNDPETLEHFEPSHWNLPPFE